MKALYAGTCHKCNKRFPAGTDINYAQGAASHVDCASAPEAPAAAPKRAANWRCPNPSDCGDPSCDGKCGYG